MASKTAQQEPEKAEVIEEALDTLDTTLDRVKVLFEQYFLGIQKQPPTFLHLDVERKLRDLSQHQIRNTALRYRLATLQQKYGSYNTYWRRTLRQIESGKYARNLSKVSRQAAKSGEDIPEEILAAMPKRMREQVRRDREVAVAQLHRRDHHTTDGTELLTLLPEGAAPPTVEPAHVDEPSTLRQPVLDPRGAYVLGVESEDDKAGDFDFDAFLASISDDNEESTQSGPPPAPVAPPAPPPRPPAPMRPSLAGQTLRADLARPASPIAQPVRPGIAQPPQAQPQRPVPGQPQRPLPGQQTPAIGQPAASGPQQRPVPGQPAPGGPPRPPPAPGRAAPLAPSQITRPNPILAGSSAARPAVPVETMAGPFPRPQDRPLGSPPARPESAAGARTPRPELDPSAHTPRPQIDPGARTPRPQLDPSPTPPMRPPPGMTDADVNALYAKYVKAKEMVGEAANPGTYNKLLKTINAQAPKIMEQYKAKGVDFSVVVKDNQVIIRAKPKT